MIITITVNPSVDRLYKLPQLNIGKLNRVTLVKKMVGGKGINAARVAALLGATTIATGFLGGQNGDYIAEQALSDPYENDFIKLDDETRNCYTIIQTDNQKTEINESGDFIAESELDALLTKTKKLLVKNLVTAVSINGSLPAKVSSDFYLQLINLIRDCSPQTKIILDTSGDALQHTFAKRVYPDYIKPNEFELAELLNQAVTTDPKEIKQEIENSDLSAIGNIVVSLGGKGALIKQLNTYYYAHFKPVAVVNTEGSGDALVGGLLYSLDQHLDQVSALKWAIAAGTANALETQTGFVEPEKVKKLAQAIQMDRLG